MSTIEKKSILNEQSFTIRLVGMNVTGFSQNDLKMDYDNSVFPLLEYNTSFGFKVDEEKENVSCILTIKTMIKETKEVLANLSLDVNFEISPFKEVVIKKKETEYDINNFILYNMASITASSARGVLYEKLKGSIPQTEIYPLLDLSQLFPFNKK